MNILLDSSALLARLLNEPGHALVTEAIASDAAMSSVNLAEVMTILVREGQSPGSAQRVLDKLPVTIHAFDQDLALQAGAMFAATRKFGLSLGDRACLALAQRENLPVLTADRAWADAGPVVGVSVRLIR
jgi:ribonuclease VapC